jgi:hypothetical protein
MQTFSVSVSCVLWITFEKEQQIPSIAIFGKCCVELKKVCRINYKLLTSNSNLRFIKSSRKKCFPHTRICRLAGFLNNKTLSQVPSISSVYTFLAAKKVYDLHFTTILAWKVMKAGLSVFRSACVTTMDTTLGFIYFLFAHCNITFCH